LRNFDSRLTERQLNKKNKCKLSNKANTVSNVAQGCRVKETVRTEPDHTSHNKTATDKSAIQGDKDYEVMNNYTMPEGDRMRGDDAYAVPYNNIIATAMGGCSLGMREDVYVLCDTVSTTTTTCTAVQPRDVEEKSGLELYEALSNSEATSSLGEKFRLQ
jgi:hypothetical protein